MLLTALPAQSQINYAFNQSSTAAFEQGSKLGPTPEGWDSKVNAGALEVVQLGVNAATSYTLITVSLWEVDTHTLLAQTIVTSSARNWVFAPLAVPVPLFPFVTYSVIGWADPSNEGWYLVLDKHPSEFEPTGAIQYLNDRFDNGAGVENLPGGITFLEHAGVPDIGYRVFPAVPEPGSVALLLGIGISSAGFLVHRHKRAHMGA